MFVWVCWMVFVWKFEMAYWKELMSLYSRVFVWVYWMWWVLRYGLRYSW